MLNPNRTFATFVCDNHNNSAHATAKLIAETPGTAYNPLFIYGECGAGKTHLLHAIGHHLLKKNKGTQIALLTMEQFLSEYIKAVEHNRIPAFREKYRQCDLLLLDDVESLAGKVRLQEEMFHTFVQLVDAQKQIVMACYCSSTQAIPEEISQMELRLVSRFESGKTTDMQPVDAEKRR
jgi:chromosomal replication initiator protein